MLKNIVQIVACYGVGMILGMLLWAGADGLAVVPVIALLSLPLLGLTIAIFALLRRWILGNLLSYCVVAPFLVAVAWVAFEWHTNFSYRGRDLYWYLSLRGVWDRALIAFTCSAIASALFWCWNRYEGAGDVGRSKGTAADV
jgi:hypothetical protein